MTDGRRGRPVSGPADSDLSHRVEALVDEAVGQAAKGSYVEAAARAEQALAIDPANATARELLESYRRLGADDDARRRQRRAIAGAAAAIEEMLEVGRWEEAATATDALALQYGPEAPVEELRARIAEARGVDLDFAELDAAIDAIRRPPGADSKALSATAVAPLDATGALVAEIEEHLRFSRLAEASAGIERLAEIPDAEDRLHKLRKRVEEAGYVAAEHRREEEILIATAAIEDRIRRGSLDEAAQSLDSLAASHGADAPLAELRALIEEARSQGLEPTAVVRSADPHTAASGHAAAESIAAMDADDVAAPAFTRGRWLAVAAVLALAAAGGWWLLRGPSAEPAAIQTASPAGAIVSNDAAGGSLDAVAGSPDAAADPDALDPAAVETAPGAIAENREPAPGEAPPSAIPAASRSDAASGEVAAAQPSPAAAIAPDAEPASPTQQVSPPDRAASPAGDAAPLDDRDTVAQGEVEDGGAGGAAEAATDLVSGAGESPQDQEREAAASQETTPQVEALTANQTPSSLEPEPAEPEPRPAPVGAGVDSGAAAPEPGSEVATTDAPESATQPAATSPSSEASDAAPRLLGCGQPGVTCVKVIRVPQPSYPAAARSRRLTASVVVDALVDENGRVVETRVLDGSFQFFNEAALQAASRAVFQPASRGGVPGRSWARITFRFDQN